MHRASQPEDILWGVTRTCGMRLSVGLSVAPFGQETPKINGHKNGTGVQLWYRQFPKCIQKLSKMSPKTIQIPKCLLNISKISPKSMQNQNVSKNSPTFFLKLSKEYPKSKMYLKCLQTYLQKVCKKCPNPNGPVVSSPEGLMQQIT